MTDTSVEQKRKAILAIFLLIGLILGIPLTFGLIIPVGLAVWGAIALKRHNQREYDKQVQRRKQDDDAAYGRRMRGY